MAAVYPVALATLEVDENLKQMRFDLVPKQYDRICLTIEAHLFLLLEFMKKHSGGITSIGSA